MPFKFVVGSCEYSNEGMNWSSWLIGQDNEREAIIYKQEDRDPKNELDSQTSVSLHDADRMPFCVLPKSAKESANVGLKNDPMLHRERLGDESFNIA